MRLGFRLTTGLPKFVVAFLCERAKIKGARIGDSTAFFLAFGRVRRRRDDFLLPPGLCDLVIARCVAYHTNCLVIRFLGE